MELLYTPLFLSVLKRLQQSDFSSSHKINRFIIHACMTSYKTEIKYLNIVSPVNIGINIFVNA